MVIRHKAAGHTRTSCTHAGAHAVVSGYRSATAADRYTATPAPEGRRFEVRDNNPDPTKATTLEIWCIPVDPGPTCERPGCRAPRSCTHSIAETTQILKLRDAMVAAGELSPDAPEFAARVRELATLTPEQVLELLAEWTAVTEPTKVCKFCDATITREAGLWVDNLSGDLGGTYDHCTENGGGHRPAKAV